MVARHRPRTKAKPEQDIDEARRFLAALAPGEKEFQFATWDDNPKRDEVNPNLAASRYSGFGGALHWLMDMNDRHAGVFVSLNATDGQGRKKENVTKIRAIMADLDGEPLDAVRKCPLEPHIVVETSEGHFHVFWRVDDLPVDQFEDVMRGCAKRLDSDPAVATLERCARLPGFFHCKDIDNRQLVKIVEINDHPPYTAAEIVKEFPPQKKAHKASKSGALILPAGAPLVAAEEYMKRHRSIGETPLLRCYRGGFYLWSGTHYREYPDEYLTRDIYKFLSDALVQKDDEVAPYNPTKHKVHEVVCALRSGTLVARDWDAPFWLDKDEYRPAENLVACRNGILNLITRELVPHDALLFATNCLPLDYGPKAPKPRRFHQFLEEIWPADKKGDWDEEAEAVLQELFGYLLTSDTRQQKLFLIVGPRRAGKGTIVWLLEQLLGKENIAYQTLSSMTGEFGRWPLIDKKLAVVSDARLGSKTNTDAVAEHLLSISGGDPQTINRKNQSFWNGRLAVRFLITTNELPTIRDASGTIASRFVLLKLTESFYGKEDVDLKDKLKPELAGIFNWALDGLDRLREQGYFKMPSSSRESIRDIEDLASPVRAFVREWCICGAKETANVKELYRAYHSWADENGHRSSPRHVFGKALRALVPTLRTEGVGLNRKYLGIAISTDGQDALDELMVEKGKLRR